MKNTDKCNGIYAIVTLQENLVFMADTVISRENKDCFSNSWK